MRRYRHGLESHSFAVLLAAAVDLVAKQAAAALERAATRVDDESREKQPERELTRDDFPSRQMWRAAVREGRASCKLTSQRVTT